MAYGLKASSCDPLNEIHDAVNEQGFFFQGHPYQVQKFLGPPFCISSSPNNCLSLNPLKYSNHQTTIAQ